MVKHSKQTLVGQPRLVRSSYWRWYALLVAFSLFACVVIAAGVSIRLLTLRRTIVTPPAQPIPAVRAMPELILSVGIPYINAKPVVPDLCFDFLKSLVGRSLVLDSTADLTALYDQADHSKDCALPVTRFEFDFTRYQIVGAVTSGTGCSIDLIYDATIADDLARTQTIALKRRVIGACGYELVRPIWLAVERSSYVMSIDIHD